MVAVPVSNTADMTRQSGADFVAAAGVDVGYDDRSDLGQADRDRYIHVHSEPDRWSACYRAVATAQNKRNALRLA